MKINDLLLKNAMIMDLKARSKQAAIEEMVDKLFEVGSISDIETFKAGILTREAQTSTGLGDGVAMPHAKNEAVTRPTVLFAKSAQGVDYEALDGQPTFLFFMIAAPEGANDTHLQALAALSRRLMEPEFLHQLKQTKTPDDVTTLFEKEPEEEPSVEVVPNATHRPFLVAVTACPTGIAHTFMAADALKKKANEMGVEIKVETNGSEGIKNRLTTEDIQRAEAVIVAADKKVEMNRFDGKRLINRPVSDGIRKTESLIEEALSKQAPIFHGDGPSSEENESTRTSFGQDLYKNLMNGVSHMLPFVIAGGILIAISFMVDQFLGVPVDSLNQLGSYHPQAAWFNEIGGAAFGFMLPVLAGFIAMSIGDRPGLVAGFAAGALANAGGAGFLGALVGGFLAGYVIVFLRKALAGLPKSLDGIKAILFYPFFGLLITGFLMLLVNVPMKIINDGLNHFLSGLDGTNGALLGILLGVMMAADLGGPINKAAYVFGTGTLAATVASGGSVVMAAVMAAGMVPPLAIFVATRLFKNKFTQQEREAGLTNIVMGLSFVTEGAIPFAASDPLRAIPSFMVGSALTGGLVGAFSIKLLAPHGGIFVLFLLNKPFLFLAFILAGAIVSGIVLGTLKKPSN
ncbi:PTS fructose transporter subunit IIABC [Enterococcus sp. LJL98]